VERGLRERSSFSYDHRIVLPDGAVRTLHGEGSVVTDAVGNPVRMSGTGQDITERKIAEDALSNKARLSFSGQTLAQEKGDGWTVGVYPEDRERRLSACSPALAHREQFVLQYRLRYHDGSYHWIIDHGMPVVGLDGEFAGHVGSCYDNEDLKLLPVVILTTSQAEEDILKSYGLHANCYIIKPVDLEQLITVVRNIEDFWLTVVTLPTDGA